MIKKRRKTQPHESGDRTIFQEPHQKGAPPPTQKKSPDLTLPPCDVNFTQNSEAIFQIKGYGHPDDSNQKSSRSNHRCSFLLCFCKILRKRNSPEKGLSSALEHRWILFEVKLKKEKDCRVILKSRANCKKEGNRGATTLKSSTLCPSTYPSLP